MVQIKKTAMHLANKEIIHKIATPPFDLAKVGEETKKSIENEEYAYFIENPKFANIEGEENDARKGKILLNNHIEKGYLIKDETERIYVYGQQTENHIQYGIVCLSSVIDYENNIIKRHENTLPETVIDRRDLCYEQNANASSVFLSFLGGENIQKKMSQIINTKSYGSFTTSDGVTHTLWLCSEEDSDYIVREFEAIDFTYICDGHHRSAAAHRVYLDKRKEALDAGFYIKGDEPYNYFLSVIYPSSQLKILEFNRLLKSLNDMTAEEFLEKLAVNFTIFEINEFECKPKSKGHISLLLQDKWYDLQLKQELISTNDPVKSLDYQILTDFVFADIIGIENISTDKRVEFIKGPTEIKQLIERCQNDCKAAFVMYPVTMEEVCNIADAKKIMPPKSSCFSPKPCSGLFVNVYSSGSSDSTESSDSSP